MKANIPSSSSLFFLQHLKSIQNPRPEEALAASPSLVFSLLVFIVAYSEISGSSKRCYSISQYGPGRWHLCCQVRLRWAEHGTELISAAQHSAASSVANRPETASLWLF